MHAKKLVLIAEDAASNRRSLVRLLSSEYTLLEAENGAAALELLHRYSASISAVILDLVMPVLDGCGFLRAIRKEGAYRNLPILVASGGAGDQTEAEALRLGAWDLITKPYHGDIVKFRLRNAIERGRLSGLTQLKDSTEYDALTGIYHSSRLFQAARALLDGAPGEQFAFVRAEFDRFQLINSFYGTQEGDRLLRYLADQLKESGRGGRFVYGRMGENVFAICCACPSQAQVIRYLEDLGESVRACNQNFDIVPIFGLYYPVDPGIPVTEMMGRAALAAQSCKGSYVNSIGIYTPEMSRTLELEQEIVSQMAAALEERQFFVCFQPKYDMRTNLPAGAEALARWQHPTRGLVPPGVFIPIFEKSGFIAKLDYYVWETVCALLQAWIRQGLNPAPISVNVSRVNLYNPNTAQIIRALVQKYEIPPALFQLELTESAYMDNPQMMERFTEQLHEMGFTILMDDFGSGYSSLSILKNIPVDGLKIDMRFFEDTKVQGRGESIIASVVRMAKWLSIPTIAEGAEKGGQVDFLRSVGCDYIQSYYFARPMPAEDYQKLMLGAGAAPSLPAPREEPFDVDRLWGTSPEIEVLFSNATQANCLYEFDGETLEAIRANRRFDDRFSYNRSAEPRMPVDHILPADRGRVLDAFRMCVGERKDAECVYRRKNAANQVLWVRLKLQYVCPVGDRHIVLGHLTDITAQKSMEFELQRFRAALPRAADGQGRTFLLVDPAPESAALLRRLFQKDCRILSAPDGEEGLLLLERHGDELSLIFLGLDLPGMDGAEFLLRKNGMAGTAGIPVIALSERDDREQELRLLRLGVNDYIKKPLIPEIVACRVKNLLEYSDRFAALVRKYQAAAAQGVDEELFALNQTYTAGEIRMMILFLSPVFDVVRLVDPVETTLVALDEDGSVRREPYRCFGIWKKDTRCENCISICGMREWCRMSKYEFIQNNVFYVVSNPIVIEDSAGARHRLALEIASHVSNHVMLEEVGEKTVGQLIEETQRKIYTDELTGAYNRRYFREMLFAHHGQTGVVRQMALVMLDMRGFKQINDQYGHMVGDDVLVQSAKALLQAVRQSDSVIRYGGDEFIVILTNCSEEQAQKSMDRLRRAIDGIRCGEEGALAVSANFGYAYTEQFDFREETLEEMIRAADKAMYLEKRRKCAAE